MAKRDEVAKEETAPTGMFVFDQDTEIVARELGINLLQFEAGVPKQVPSGWEHIILERGGKPV